MSHTTEFSQSMDAIGRQLQELLRQHPVSGRDGLLSVTVAAPLLDGFALPELVAPYFFWEDPLQGRTLLGVGVAEKITAQGTNRFVSLHRDFDWQQRHWQRLSPPTRRPFAAAFAGIAFDAEDEMTGGWSGFPNGLLHIPSLLLHRFQEECTLTFSCRKSALGDLPGQLRLWLGELEALWRALSAPRRPAEQPLAWCSEDIPSKQGWVETVGQATHDIDQGGLQKVVCARSRTLHLQHTLQVAPLMAKLRQHYPDCYQIAANLHGTPLVAATPERLLQLQGGTLRCDALGGSAPRAESAARDRLLAQGLMHNPKTRHEHRLVVEYIREALAPLCHRLDIPDGPELFRLRNIQHLRTRINGEIHEGTSLLALAARLHPTPAVCGVPLAQAQQWLRHRETFGRGWYSGAVGWLGADGDGELNVLLRCALLQGEQVTLFAGAGVVANSLPQEEWEETELKLEALFGALQHPQDRRPVPACTAGGARR